jgi:hypothetical protein
MDPLLENSKLISSFQKEKLCFQRSQKGKGYNPTIPSFSFSITTNDQAKAQQNYQQNFVLLSHTIRIPTLFSHF